MQIWPRPNDQETSTHRQEINPARLTMTNGQIHIGPEGRQKLGLTVDITAGSGRRFGRAGSRLYMVASHLRQFVPQ